MQQLTMESVLRYTTECSADVLLTFVAVFVVTYLLYRRQNVSYSGVKLPPAMQSIITCRRLTAFHADEDERPRSVWYQWKKQTWQDFLISSGIKV